MIVKRAGRSVSVTKKSIGAVSPSLLKIKRAAFERKKQTEAFKRWRRYQYFVKNKRACTYCKHKFTGPIYVDHFVCLFRGGTSAYSNLHPVCNPCNIYKGVKIPTATLMLELRNGVGCGNRH
jgi:5-methylcytosine-specific restriction endonuclease McrA